MSSILDNQGNAPRLPRSVFASLLLASLIALTQAACEGGKPDTRQSNAMGGAPDAKAAQNAPAADAVKVEVAPVRLARGGSTDGVVRVVVAPGFHVNANPATHSYLIPTALSVRSGNEAGVTVSAPVYPEGVTHKFAFDPTPLRVYEGAVEIKLGLQATREAAAGERALPLRLRVQPCDDAVCHPPRTLEAALPIIVE